MSYNNPDLPKSVNKLLNSKLPEDFILGLELSINYIGREGAINAWRTLYYQSNESPVDMRISNWYKDCWRAYLNESR